MMKKIDSLAWHSGARDEFGLAHFSQAKVEVVKAIERTAASVYSAGLSPTLHLATAFEVISSK